MLKLTNSFYRYVNCFITESNQSNIRSRKFSQLWRRKVCGIACRAGAEELHTTQILIKKKGYSIRIPPFDADVHNTNRLMNNLPSNKHVSHGGTFQISQGEKSPRNTKKESESSDKDTIKIQPQVIPRDFRVWEPVGNHRDSCKSPSLKFKVVSYNVLAQHLLECHPDLYRGCSPSNLKWDVRAARLYNEIMELCPDILCLQEVQASHVNSFYSKFEQVGYFGIFKQKTGQRGDGCAVYFKRSMFELQDHISVEFYQPELPILNRDNIGMILKLVPRSFPGSAIIVATTHLLYNPKRTDVRLAQMQLLLAELDRFAYCSSGTQSGHLPIILTGDLNSMPESAVIELLDRGNVRASRYRDSSDWRRIEVTDNCQHLSVYLNRQQGRTTDFNNVKIYNSEYSTSPSLSPSEESRSFSSQNFGSLFNSGDLGHSLNLLSAYDKFKQDGEEEATTFQDYWVTVDYIYFSCCHSLRLTERLRLPTVSECDVLGCLPNDVYASDHLALAAIFELKPYKSTL